jgi:hypothetical protein
MQTNCTVVLRQAIDAFELLLDEYQYNHWWDSAAERAMETLEELKRIAVTLEQKEHGDTTENRK